MNNHVDIDSTYHTHETSQTASQPLLLISANRQPLFTLQHFSKPSLFGYFVAL